MKKRILSLVIILVMTLGFLPTVSFADEKETTDGLQYYIEDSTVIINGYSGTENDITIPSEIEGYPVTRIQYRAFSNCMNVVDIKIPDSVVEIGTGAFENCTNLKNITLSSNISEIGWQVFKNCISLTSIEIPNNITSIGFEAFKNCSSLKNIIISDATTNIEEKAFEGTAYYNDLSNWQNGVLYIGSHLIIAKNVSGKYTIAEGTLTISDYAFTSCGDLSDIIIPDSVTYIGNSAFFECSNLKNISISDKITYIGSYAFTYTAYYNDENNWYNNVFYVDKYCVEADNSISGLCEIKLGTILITESAFSHCKNLTSVLFPSGLKKIGERAFYACEELESITIPDGVTSIENQAFSYCDNLQSAIIGNGVKIIGNSAFSHCNNLSSINIGNNVIKIEDSAFYNCNSIASVIIPDSVTNIGMRAFEECTSLESVSVGKGVSEIGECAFNNCNIKDVYINDIAAWCNLKFADALANPFCNARNLYLNDALLTELIIPDSVKEIGDYAFTDCDSIKTLVMHDNIISIGEDAFSSCDNIRSVELPKSLKYLGNDAFSYCNINSIEIPDYVEYIGNGAFFYCPISEFHVSENNLFYSSVDGVLFNKEKTVLISYPKLKICNYYIMPNTVTHISDYAFYDCNYSLNGITFSDKIKQIGQYSFGYCTWLESIIIPVSIKHIDQLAFWECENLTNVFYYQGSEKDKNSIIIQSGNENLVNAEWIYCDCMHELTPATCTTPLTCTLCGMGLGSAAGHFWSSKGFFLPGFEMCELCGIMRRHEHEYTDSCDTSCNTCYEIRTVEHKYDNACDKDCNVCGVVRTTSHKYDNSCDKDCNVCGATRTITHAFDDYVYNNDATTEKDGTKTKTCSVCGHKETVTVTGTKLPKPQAQTNPFTDIKAKDFYYKPTLWAVANNITTGTSKTSFSPNEACTRGQIVTFLWRAAGCPEPKTTTMPFTDVGSKAFYRKAVLWAVENGITSGTSKTTFSPNDPCTRGQIATFLWRAKGKPTPTSTNMPFNDVAKKDFYYKAVLWAVENKITSGTSKTTFEPNVSCTRGQIVTFLYRAYN